MHNLQSVLKKEFKAVSKLIGDKVTWGDIIVAILFVAYVLILPGLIHKLET